MVDQKKPPVEPVDPVEPNTAPLPNADDDSGGGGTKNPPPPSTGTNA